MTKIWICFCASAIALAVGCDGNGDVDAGPLRPDGGTVSDGGGGSDSGGIDGGGGGDDAGAGTDAAMSVDSGMSGGSCAAPTVTSPCGPQAVVRVRATLGAGMGSMTGALVANLHHLALGGGATGGFLHTNATSAGATISPTEAAEVHMDFCAGGEMWSEENCGYNLWVYLDLNGNSSLDAGEPAGRVEVDVNCHGTGALCESVVLDCLDGMACAAFADTGCACRTPNCDGIGGASRIVTCT